MRLLTLVRESPFLRHNAVFFFGSLGVAALNYLYYPVLGRLLEPADFGEVQTLITLFTQATIFLGILTYITIYVTVNVDDVSERNQIIVSLERLALRVAAAVLLGAAVLAGVVRSFLQFETIWPFLILLIAFALTIPTLVRIAFLRGRKQYFKSALIDGISSAGKLVLSPLLVLLGLRSLGALVGVALSQIVSLGFGLVWAHRADLGKLSLAQKHVDFHKLRPQLRYGAAVFLVSSAVTALLSLDMLAVKHYFPPHEAGLYAGVTTVARIIFFLAAPFTGVLLTLVSTRQPMQKNVLWLKGSLGLTLLIGGGAVAVMTGLPELVVRLLVGSKYLAFADILPRLGLAMLLLGLANTLLMYHIALKHYRLSVVPVLVTFFTLILIHMRHNAVVQVVDDILASSVLLILSTLIISLFHKSK